MGILVKPGFRLNLNHEVAEAISKRVEINNVENPCVRPQSAEYDDIYCPCKDYLIYNNCHCGLYNSISLTKDLLLQNGWQEYGEVLVLKTPEIRLGWRTDNNKFILGFTELPVEVKYLWQLFEIYRQCGLITRIGLFKY